jgi:hypothetical protein
MNLATLVHTVTVFTACSGVAKGAFIADPWENIFELLELARESESLVTRQ